MRVLIDVTERAGAASIRLTADVPLTLPERPVRWAGGRLPVAPDEQVSDEDAVRLAGSVDRGDATPGDLERYGRLLFGALFGTALSRAELPGAALSRDSDDEDWQALLGAAAGTPCLELAIRGPGQVQAVRWEALHDGRAHVAIKGSASRDGRRVPVNIVRLIPLAGAGPEFRPIGRMPRVLFAVGSRLTDPRVRPGAEVMGILRHLDRGGGAIYHRVLESATRESLAAAIAGFKPDIVHLIGHGRPGKDGSVLLQLQEDGPVSKDDYVTAAQLLDILNDGGRMPAMVLLSACQTASGPGAPGAGASGTVPSEAGASGAGASVAGPGGAGHVNGLPFAATLVAGGVPVVAAMAGDIADTACRVFTRGLALAIEGGRPLGEAVIHGRGAAFREKAGIDSTDWVLPAIFLDERVATGAYLVDRATIEAVRDRIRYLKLDDEPVFFGRGDFVAAMDQLLDPSPATPLNVLVAYTRDPSRKYGSWRLLQELSARAVRAGCLPVLLGRYDQEPPDSRAALAKAIGKKLRWIRDGHGLDPVEYQVRAVAADPGAEPEDLAAAIRADFARLAANLPETDPVRLRPEPRIVLLCHRVDLWGTVLDDLADMIGPRGLGPGVQPLPVVLTGVDAAGSRFHEALESSWRGSWVKCAPLDWFRMDDADAEDMLAYLTWLLNPVARPGSGERYPVYAPRRGAPKDWQGTLRLVMHDLVRSLYSPTLFEVVATMGHAFTSENDDDLLAGLGLVGHGIVGDRVVGGGVAGGGAAGDRVIGGGGLSREH